MILGAEIAMLFLGLYSLFTGKFKISKDRVVEGGTARLVGLFWILPLPVMLLVGFFIGATGNFQLFQNRSGALIAVEVVVVLTCLIVGAVIGYSAPRN